MVVCKAAALRAIGGNSWPDDSAVGKRPVPELNQACAAFAGV